MWITQLVRNLIDNALRYTPRGGAIRLALTTEDAGASIAVSDSVGIAAEHLPHIFERFYRADSSRARDTGGVGLGLSICAWVAGAHGGHIAVESIVGRGTTPSRAGFHQPSPRQLCQP